MWSSLLLVPIGATLTWQHPLQEDIEKRADLSITLSSTTPSGASNIVDHGYPGFAFSSHSFWEYAGNASSPNTFSANLIQSVSNRTGAPVHIRVGGTSGDFAHYDPNQATALVYPPGTGPADIPHGLSIGNAWFEGLANFQNVKWTYMAHLANNSDGFKANSVQAVQQALKYIGNNLENLEVGNEIDFYPGMNRPSTYNALAYVNEWKDYVSAINAAVGNKTYEAPVFAFNNCPFCVANTFGQGQDDLGNVKSVALHNYMDSGPVPATSVQANYLNHTRIVKTLQPFTTPIAWLTKNHPDIPLYLAEVNSNTYSKGNNDVIGIFGSALWLVDYLLYGTILNIGRINVQQSTGFSYASWRGVSYNGLPPAVLPPYYAHPFVADVIGNSGDIKIASLPISGDTFSGYAIYDAGSNALKRVALINLQLYNSTTGGTRPTQKVNLDAGSSYRGTSVKVEKLTAPGAEVQDSSKISWKGQSWTYASAGKAYSTTSTTQQVRVSGGKFSVNVQGSEAVLITL